MKTGIFYNIPFDDYKKIDAINNSVLKVIAEKTPLHARHYMDNGLEETQALSFGKGLHCRLLEPELFDKSYVVSPKFDRRTKQGKVDSEAFEVAHQGKEVLTEDDYKTIQVIATRIENSLNSRLVREGKPEVVVIWQDTQTGLFCKARIDYLHIKLMVIVDLKSTQDASQEAFARSIFNYGYHQQAAFYIDGLKEITGEEAPFVLFAIEKQPPYGVAAYEIDTKTIMAGRKAYREALSLYAECVKSGNWPGYPEKVQLINMPDWALNKSGYSEYEVVL